MEELFLLAERVVTSLKKTISSELLHENRYSFDESVIKGSSLTILFSNSTKKILLNLSTHPLDMPWSFEVTIIQAEHKTNFNDIIRTIKNDGIVYEVYPNLLKDPEVLGNKLANEISNDLLTYLITKE